MITIAKDGMRTDLERIWRLCFNSPADTVRYFFDYRYNANSCAVYIDESVGRPVAMVHMLNANITEDSEIIPTQFIYGAATRPDYQRRGIMKQLMVFAHRYAAVCGQKYQVLVPAARSQFKYFENRGFYRCFKYRSVFMTRSDLVAISDYDRQRRDMHKSSFLSINDINSVRRDMLLDREGFVSWDYQSFNYAVGLHEQTGGNIITAANDSDAGYAFCRIEPDGTVLVSEFIAHSDFCAELVRKILDAYDQQRFEFRLPVYNEFFSQFGEVVDYGMICAASGRKPINILTLSGTHTPYMGLALD